MYLVAPSSACITTGALVRRYQLQALSLAGESSGNSARLLVAKWLGSRRYYRRNLVLSRPGRVAALAAADAAADAAAAAAPWRHLWLAVVTVVPLGVESGAISRRRPQSYTLPARSCTLVAFATLATLTAAAAACATRAI